MFRIISLSALSIVILLLCHCSCGDDVILGFVEFNGATNDFKVYAATDAITFVDSVGTEKTYKVISYSDTLNGYIVVGTVCNEGVFNNAYAQYEYQAYQVYLNSGTDYISINLNIFNLNDDEATPGDTLMTDQFDIQSVIDGNHAGFRLITNYRGHETRITQEQRDQMELFRYIADTVILNQTFTDLYANTGLQYQIFFKPKVGVVALVDNGNPFVLK